MILRRHPVDQAARRSTRTILKPPKAPKEQRRDFRGTRRSPSAALLVLLAAATGARLIASNLPGAWYGSSATSPILPASADCQLPQLGDERHASRNAPTTLWPWQHRQIGLAFHARKQGSPRRRLHLVSSTASDDPLTTESPAGTPAEVREDGNGFQYPRSLRQARPTRSSVDVRSPSASLLMRKVIRPALYGNFGHTASNASAATATPRGTRSRHDSTPACSIGSRSPS